MFKKLVCFLTILTLLGTSCFSQNQYGDSLKKLLSKTQIDTAKSQLQYLISWNYIGVNVDSALLYNKKAFELSEKTGKEKFKANVLDEQGFIFAYENLHDKAVEAHFAALKIHQKIKNKKGMVYSLNGIGSVFYAQGNPEKAAEYYEQALKISLEAGDNKSTFLTLNYLGNVHSLLKEHQLALHYFNKSLEYSDKNSSPIDIADVYTNLSSVYLALDKLDSALILAKKSFELHSAISPKTARIADILNVTGKIYFGKGDYKTAIIYAEKSYALSDELGIEYIKIQAAKNLADYYEAAGDYKTAFNYQKIYIDINEKSSKVNEVSNLESKFIKEKENEIRKKEKEIQEYRDKINKITAISITTLLLLVCLVFYLRYKSKQKSHQLLEVKNKIIEDKQKEILDSIHYAQRIQKALITSEKYIEKQINRLKED